jgi:hypothetical protein
MVVIKHMGKDREQPTQSESVRDDKECDHEDKTKRSRTERGDQTGATSKHRSNKSTT